MLIAQSIVHAQDPYPLPAAASAASASNALATPMARCTNYAKVLQQAGYPRRALELKLYEGSALVEFKIGNNQVADVKVIRASHPVFADEAMRIVAAFTCNADASSHVVSVRVPFQWRAQ